MSAIPAPAREPARLMAITRVGGLPLVGIASLMFVSHLLGGGNWYWLTALTLIFIAPVADVLIGEDPSNASDAQETHLRGRWWLYRASLWVYFPVQVAAMLVAHQAAAAGDLSWFAFAGLMLSNAVAVGIGGTLGHELCHRDSLADRIVGTLVFSVCWMSNFIIYHNYGHHRLVASPQDPGSARYGESFWHFTWRNTFAKFLLSWRIEAQRLRSAGQSPWSPRNRMIWLSALDMAWPVGLITVFGWTSLPLFVLQYIGIRGLLSVGDYLEHYGLSRARRPDGSYEPPRPIHSWDDGYVVSSLVTTVVNRHADHHTNEDRPFHLLRYQPDAPRYPYGNLVMIWCAFVPPLWRKVVHPVLDAYYARQPDVVPHGYPHDLPAAHRDRAVHA